ncbi:hypothetical protein CBS9595_000173 [Malassezia furfur]|nr:hypothetical protein CBS9595_000173 [Malassezia furfur]
MAVPTDSRGERAATESPDQASPSFDGCDAAAPQATAPFLTNVENHLGRVTLTAPDNMRRRRGRDRRQATDARPPRLLVSQPGRAGTSDLHRLAREAHIPARRPGPSASHTTRTRTRAHPPGRSAAPRGSAARRSARAEAPQEAAAPRAPPAAEGRAWDRRLNVWDEIEPELALEELDLVDPPPAFAAASPSPPAHAPDPQSPPPPFVSDDEAPAAPTAAADADSDASSDVEAAAPIDPRVMQQRMAWESDRLAGYSLEERVRRMHRRLVNASEAWVQRAESAAPVTYDAPPATEPSPVVDTRPAPRHGAPRSGDGQVRPAPPIRAPERLSLLAPVSRARSGATPHHDTPRSAARSGVATTRAPSPSRVLAYAPRSPSRILHEVRAPAPVSGGRDDTQLDDESSDDEDPGAADSSDSELEWQREHDALRALHQYEEDMRKAVRRSRMRARESEQSSASAQMHAAQERLFAAFSELDRHLPRAPPPQMPSSASTTALYEVSSDSLDSSDSDASGSITASQRFTEIPTAPPRVAGSETSDDRAEVQDSDEDVWSAAGTSESDEEREAQEREAQNEAQSEVQGSEVQRREAMAAPAAPAELPAPAEPPEPAEPPAPAEPAEPVEPPLRASRPIRGAWVPYGTPATSVAPPVAKEARMEASHSAVPSLPGEANQESRSAHAPVPPRSAPESAHTTSAAALPPPPPPASLPPQSALEPPVAPEQPSGARTAAPVASEPVAVAVPPPRPTPAPSSRPAPPVPDTIPRLPRDGDAPRAPSPAAAVPALAARVATPTAAEADRSATTPARPRRPAPHPPSASRGGDTSIASTSSTGSTSRPLPPPPPSQVPFLRTAYDQLREMQATQPVPGAPAAPTTAPSDAHFASLEAYLESTMPSVRAEAEPAERGVLPRPLSHYGGAFTNPRSSAAPLPTHSRLPTITGATRHFPPTRNYSRDEHRTLPPEEPAEADTTPAAPPEAPAPTRVRRRAPPPPLPPRERHAPPPRRVVRSAEAPRSAIPQRPDPRDAAPSVPPAEAPREAARPSEALRSAAPTMRPIRPPVPPREASPAVPRAEPPRHGASAHAAEPPRDAARDSLAWSTRPAVGTPNQRTEAAPPVRLDELPIAYTAPTIRAVNPPRVAAPERAERGEAARSEAMAPAAGGPPATPAAPGASGAPSASDASPGASPGVTDLDVVVAQLDDPATQYEWATLLGEFLGPASTTKLTPDELQAIAVGRVELDHQRVSSSGKLKKKLSVVGVRVDRCGICLQQFREGQLACIWPCVHMYVAGLTQFPQRVHRAAPPHEPRVPPVPPGRGASVAHVPSTVGLLSARGGGGSTRRARAPPG